MEGLLSTGPTPSSSEYCSQPTVTVATSWWAFSLLIECTEDESPQQELEGGPHSKVCVLDTKFMFYLLVNLVLQDYSQTYSYFPWSPICPSFLTRPSCLLSRLIGMHALASSVGRILKLPLSLLAFRQFQHIFFLNRLFKGVLQLRIEFLMRMTGQFVWILPRMYRG